MPLCEMPEGMLHLNDEVMREWGQLFESDKSDVSNLPLPSGIAEMVEYRAAT